MTRWFGGLILLSTCVYLSWPLGRWSPLLGQLVVGSTAAWAWSLAGPTAMESPYRPHRVGAWTLRLLWGITLVTLPFRSWWIEPIRNTCLLFGFAMLFSLIGRIFRSTSHPKDASISDLVAVFGFGFGCALLWVPSLPNLPKGLAMSLLALTIGALLWRLPTSATQNSDADHRTSA